MSGRPGQPCRRWTPHAAREWERLCERVQWDAVELAEPDREFEPPTADDLAELCACTSESFALGELAEAELRRQGRTLDDLLPRTWARDVTEGDWRAWGLKPPRYWRRRQAEDQLGVPQLPPNVL